MRVWRSGPGFAYETDNLEFHTVRALERALAAASAQLGVPMGLVRAEALGRDRVTAAAWGVSPDDRDVIAAHLGTTAEIVLHLDGQPTPLHFGGGARRIP
jgi:hypothetical protein